MYYNNCEQIASLQSYNNFFYMVFDREKVKENNKIYIK